MTDEKYKRTQAKILEMAKEVKSIDLPGFIDRINDAQAAAPVLDPTLYIKAAESMGHIKQLAEGLIEFQNTVESLTELARKQMQRNLTEAAASAERNGL